MGIVCGHAEGTPVAIHVLGLAVAGRLSDRWDGGTTAVLFWSPTCGFCHRMLPDLRAWEADRLENTPRLLIIAAGSAEENRAMGLTSPTLMDGGFAAGRAFGATGTPQAAITIETRSRSSAIGTARSTRRWMPMMRVLLAARRPTAAGAAR